MKFAVRLWIPEKNATVTGKKRTDKKMDDLIFYEKNHIYMLDGQRLPCVSDLCRFLHKEIYKDAPLWQMEAAADRGTSVHRATELLDKTGTAEISEEYAPYLEAYAAFRREHDVEWELIEHPDHHPVHGYAGTIDRFGKVDGFATLLDIKTTWKVHKPLCSASLNLYRMILEFRERASPPSASGQTAMLACGMARSAPAAIASAACFEESEPLKESIEMTMFI